MKLADRVCLEYELAKILCVLRREDELQIVEIEAELTVLSCIYERCPVALARELYEILVFGIKAQEALQEIERQIRRGEKP